MAARTRIAGALAGSGEALVAGGVMGGVFGGPVGALVGAGVGLMGALRKRNEMDTLVQLSTAAEQGLARAQQFAIGPAQQAEFGLMQDTLRGYQVAASSSPDPQTRQAATNALADYATGTVLPLLSSWETQRAASVAPKIDELQTMTVEARDRYMKADDNLAEVFGRIDEGYRLLNSGQDINNPLIRGKLIELIQSSSRTVGFDPTGEEEILQSTGMGLPIYQQLLNIDVTKMDAGDFAWTKDQWNAVLGGSAAAAKRIAGDRKKDALRVGEQINQEYDFYGYRPTFGDARLVIAGSDIAELPAAAEGSGAGGTAGTGPGVGGGLGAAPGAPGSSQGRPGVPAPGAVPDRAAAAATERRIQAGEPLGMLRAGVVDSVGAAQDAATSAYSTVQQTVRDFMSGVEQQRQARRRAYLETQGIYQGKVDRTPRRPTNGSNR